jgi:hypothetical protein
MEKTFKISEISVIGKDKALIARFYSMHDDYTLYIKSIIEQHESLIMSIASKYVPIVCPEMREALTNYFFFQKLRNIEQYRD